MKTKDFLYVEENRDTVKYQFVPEVVFHCETKLELIMKTNYEKMKQNIWKPQNMKVTLIFSLRGGVNAKSAVFLLYFSECREEDRGQWTLSLT